MIVLRWVDNADDAHALLCRCIRNRFPLSSESALPVCIAFQPNSSSSSVPFSAQTSLSHCSNMLRFSSTFLVSVLEHAPLLALSSHPHTSPLHSLTITTTPTPKPETRLVSKQRRKALAFADKLSRYSQSSTRHLAIIESHPQSNPASHHPSSPSPLSTKHTHDLPSSPPIIAVLRSFPLPQPCPPCNSTSTNPSSS